MHAKVGVEVGDHDPVRVHAALAHEQPMQVAAAPRHRAALADDDPRLERVEDVDELGEFVAELLAQGAGRSRSRPSSVSRVMIAQILRSVGHSASARARTVCRSFSSDSV